MQFNLFESSMKRKSDLASYVDFVQVFDPLPKKVFLFGRKNIFLK